MRTHTQDFKNEIKQYGRQLSQYLYTGTTLIRHLDNSSSNRLSRDEINSIKYYYDCDIFKTRMQTLVIDSKVEIPIGTEIDCRLGLIVNNSPENLLFGYFYVNKVEQQKDKKSWLVTCYDKMIETMKDYESFYIVTTDTTFTTNKNYYQLTNGKYKRYTDVRTGNPSSLGLYQSAFPMTIKDYILAICNRLNITTLSISSETSGNFLKEVTSEHYVDVDGNSMGYTYRDVLDDIAEAIGEFLYIGVGYFTHRPFITTNDTINEEYFNDKNVTIGEKVGPYNVVVLSRASDSDNIYYPSTLPSNPIEFKISDNLILEQDNREDFIQGIYNKINGLEFYTNNFTTKGILYYELSDKFNVSIDGTTYTCLMLNDDITITTGLKEIIRTDEPKQSVTAYKYASYSDKVAITSKNASIKVDKANASIEQIVEAVGDNGEVTSASIVTAINNDTSSIKLEADKIDINGVVSANNNFKIKTDGSVEINNGTIDLVDNGLTETIPELKITGRDNVVTNDIYSYGMYIDNANGTKVDLTFNGYYSEHTNNDNSKEITQIEQFGDFLAYRTDTNGNITNSVFLSPGDDLDSAFKLADTNGTRFEVYNGQSNTFMKIKGSIVTTDSNNNQTFDVDGTTGNITIGGVVKTGAGIWTHNKTSTSDGLPGIYLGSGGIEIFHNTTPFIDFHYANSTSDYTSRIIESSSGTLSVSNNLKVTGNITASNFSDSDWQNCTTSQGTWSYCKVRKIGKMVELRGYASSLGSPNGTIFTIPSGYRPSNQVYTTGHDGYGTGYSISRWYINTNGTCGIDWCVHLSNGTAKTGATWKSIQATWLVD